MGMRRKRQPTHALPRPAGWGGRERVRKDCSLGREKTQHDTSTSTSTSRTTRKPEAAAAQESTALRRGRVAIRQYEYNEHKAWTSQVHKRTLKKQFPPRRLSPLLSFPLLSRLLLLLLLVYWCW
jgi:hypothetical protein